MLMCIIWNVYPRFSCSSNFIRFLFLPQEVDPCEDLTDNDIRTAIQNATGAKSALFVPEVTPND